ncbi:MAG: hypothetical protein B6I25_08525 [Planctomycetales bacterium 4572_13]|nr:MAG: hypothetical protein B6I25_08525 [Planctomycetales bacterium 4572_13]
MAEMVNHKNKMTNKKPVTGGLQNISPKVMAMVVLLAVMAILWGRVLLKGKGGLAAANAQNQISAQEIVSDSPLQIEAVELPVLPGRNDRVSNGLFGGENWTAFELNPDTPRGGVKVGGTGDSAELAHRSSLERIAERLKLEAVICDAQNRPFQAFVDDKILSVGSTLTVQEGPDQFVLMLEEISEKQVVFSWNEMSVILKMAETF